MRRLAHHRWKVASCCEAVAATLLAVAAVLASVVTANGQCVWNQQTGQFDCAPQSGAVARWNDPSICQLDGASGSYISIDGDSSYILSCAHDAPTTAGGAARPMWVGQQVQGMSRHGQPLSATVFAVDRNADLAILHFNGTAQHPATIAEREPAAGESLWFAGFPMGGGLRVAAIRHQAAHSGIAEGISDPPPRPGDSGGPVFNRLRQIVGVISGVNGRQAFYGRLPAIRALIERVRALRGRQIGQGTSSPGGVVPQGQVREIEIPPLSPGSNSGWRPAQTDGAVASAGGVPPVASAQPLPPLEQQSRLVPVQPIPNQTDSQVATGEHSVLVSSQTEVASPAGAVAPNCNCVAHWQAIDESNAEIKQDIKALFGRLDQILARPVSAATVISSPSPPAAGSSTANATTPAAAPAAPATGATATATTAHSTDVWNSVAIAVAGGSVPAAIAYWLATRAWKRFSKRIRRPAADREPAADPQRYPGSAKPVAVDSPPKTRYERGDNQYVPFEDSKFQRAHQWATAQVVRKFPGCTEAIQTLESLIKQHVNANPTSET